MDKAGHIFSSYYLGKILTKGFISSGVNNKKSILYGSGLGFIYISSIEVFDGFSEKWGASISDLLTNAIGVGIYAGEELIWNEQKIILKYSFHKSPYAKYRPDALGKNFAEMLIKDYNGQTYWLSANIKSIIKVQYIPKWLNIAFGYSADGMTGGLINPTEVNNITIPQFERKRQFYFSFDIDLSKIQTKSKALDLVLNTVNIIKFPFPALEINKKELKLYLLYF